MMGRVSPQSSRRLRTSGFNLDAVSQFQRLALLPSQRQQVPWENPSTLMDQVRILLSVELTPSEEVMSLIHGTKLENTGCLINRS